MVAVPILALIGVLGAKALLDAHHGAPVHEWERWLTWVAVALSAVVLVLFVLRVQQLVGG